MISTYPLTLVILIISLVSLGLATYIVLIPYLIPNNYTTSLIIDPRFRHDKYANVVTSIYAKSNYSAKLNKCEGKYVYLYELPHEFNEDLVDKCGRLSNNWLPLCGTLTHYGYGPKVNFTRFNVNRTLLPPHAWYKTEQFAVELLFHHRLKSYPCLTKNPTLASVFFIPYYGALDTAFTLFSPNLHLRDQLAHRLVGWLTGNPTWMEFKDRKAHAMVLGRVSWDFSRNEESSGSGIGWGSALFAQEELENVTKLLIERRTWRKDEMAIPYPTSFHPSSYQDVIIWQEQLTKYAGPNKRGWLCSFIGSKSRGIESSRELRAELSKQCAKAGELMCYQVTCIEGGDGSAHGAIIDCIKHPDHVTSLLLNSTFCLQPPGDSPTRKSLFDSLVSGCIPVLFSPLSAYDQYIWHLPQNHSTYSVMFDAYEVAHQHIDVVTSLKGIAGDTNRLRRMQLAIIDMLPRIVYAFPPTWQADQPLQYSGIADSSLGFHDAVDVALERLFKATSSL